MECATFECNALSGTGKKGILKQDNDGYYTTPVGALNVMNSVGEYYSAEKAADLFKQSSPFIRRIQKSALKAEWGHPKIDKNASNSEYLNRMLQINEDQICGHHKRIWLEPDLLKDENGVPIIAIMSSIKPTGPKGQYLQESFDNPNENTSFSIRALHDLEFKFNKRIKHLKTIITFDYVNEPGIAVAQKYLSPTLEGHDDSRLITKEDFKEDISNIVTTESVKLTIDEFFNTMGWAMEGYSSPTNSPLWLKWK